MDKAIREHRSQPLKALSHCLDALESTTGELRRDPANATAIRDWTVEYFEALHPYSAGGAYVNFMMDEGQDRVKASFRENYDRLASVKQQYDPGNLFRVNQNIQPVSATV